MKESCVRMGRFERGREKKERKRERERSNKSGPTLDFLKCLTCSVNICSLLKQLVERKIAPCLDCRLRFGACFQNEKS